MSRSHRGDLVLPFLTVVSDALAVEAAFLLAYWLRFHTGLFSAFGFLREEAPPLRSYVVASLFVIVVWLLLFNARKMYGLRRNVNLSDELINVFKVVSLGMMLVMSAAFFYRTFSYSRVVIVLVWVLAIAGVFFGRVVMKMLERRSYRHGRNLQSGIIIGSGELAAQVYTRLHQHISFGITITGYFADAPAGTGALSSAQHLGTISEVPSFLTTHDVTLAFIALPSEDHQRLFQLISECEGINVEFMMVPDLLDVMTSQVRLRDIEGIPFLRLKGIPLTIWGRITKRAFDLAVSSIILAILSPLYALLALLITLDSPGPVLFRQRRVGLDGKEFTMLKFRSMVVGAERHDAEAGLGIRGDARRTRIGKFLRRASLDELPQFWNVFRGDMSLVGPRPERTHVVEKFGDVVPKYLDRHRVKTGLTGWAQVNGLRGGTSIDERVKYDLYYMENWSLAFDIRILLRTLKAVVTFHEQE
jgi:exopolysaccharide biosynthesis polyprenyl glycosylphosphotransferase